MKKFLLISSFILMFTCIKCETTHALSELSPDNTLISSYLYGDLDRIHRSTNLLARTILANECDLTQEQKQDYIDRINYNQDQISFFITELNNQIPSNKNNPYVLNGIYALELIFQEYRYALSLLKSYVNSKDSKDQYYNLESFFIVNSQATQKLNKAKQEIPQ